QYQRNHQQFTKQVDEMPVFGTIASQFNDPGMNQLYRAVMEKIAEKTSIKELKPHLEVTKEMSEKIYIIPPARTRYLSEITETIRKYDEWSSAQSNIAQKLFGLKKSIEVLNELNVDDKDRFIKKLEESYAELELKLDGQNKKLLHQWNEKCKNYLDEFYTY